MKPAIHTIALRALLLVTGLTTSASAEVVTLQPVRDNTLFEDATGSLSDGAGPVLYSGNNGQGLARRGLLQFDVTGLPAGAVIEQVTLTLHVSNAPNSTPRAFALHRVLEGWGEGSSNTSSGTGAPATANDATWIHTGWPDGYWATAGGSFDAAESASQAVSDVGFCSWSDSRMAHDVQQWLDEASGNHGWLILGDEVTLNTAHRFDSRENTVGQNRPMLLVQFSRTVGVDSGDESRTVTLEGAMPNPTAGASRVVFHLPRPAHVRLEVHDVTGRSIAVLVDQELPSGRHSALWRGGGPGGPAGPGIYFLKISVEGRDLASKRVIRLR